MIIKLKLNKKTLVFDDWKLKFCQMDLSKQSGLLWSRDLLTRDKEICKDEHYPKLLIVKTILDTNNFYYYILDKVNHSLYNDFMSYHDLFKTDWHADFYIDEDIPNAVEIAKQKCDKYCKNINNLKAFI